MSGFSALMQYIYCGEEKTITDITDLDLLFQVYILADKVRLRSFDLVAFFKKFGEISTVPYMVLRKKCLRIPGGKNCQCIPY